MYYTSLVLDSGYIDNILDNGPYMIKFLKTIKQSPSIYLAYADTENEYEKIMSSMRIIEYFILSQYAEIYRKEYAVAQKLNNKALSDLFKAMGSYKEIIIYKNKNYLLKKASILLAEKILSRFNAK